MPRAVQRATAADVPYSMSSGCATTQSTRWKESSGRAGNVMPAILPRFEIRRPPLPAWRAHLVRRGVEVGEPAVGAEVLHPQADEGAGEAPRLGLAGLFAARILVGEDRRVQLQAEVLPVAGRVGRVGEPHDRAVELDAQAHTVEPG